MTKEAIVTFTAYEDGSPTIAVFSTNVEGEDDSPPVVLADDEQHALTSVVTSIIFRKMIDG